MILVCCPSPIHTYMYVHVQLVVYVCILVSAMPQSDCTFCAFSFLQDLPFSQGDQIIILEPSKVCRENCQKVKLGGGWYVCLTH